MSQTPRHINTDRSLSRPDQAARAPQAAPEQNTRSTAGAQHAAPPRRPAQPDMGGDNAPRRRKKKKKTPLWLPLAVTLAVLAVITQFYTAFQNNLWVAAAMRGIRAVVVPIMISAVLGMVGSAFRYPPCYAVMLLVIALYLFFNVNCVYLVVIGAVCGLLIAEFYERKGDKKHDGAA